MRGSAIPGLVAPEAIASQVARAMSSAKGSWSTGMSAKPYAEHSGRFSWWEAGAVFLAAAWLIPPAQAQTTTTSASSGKTEQQATSEPRRSAVSDGRVVPAGCNSCSAGLAPAAGASDGCGVGCVPGRTCQVDSCEPDSCIGRLIQGLYECICCPDPCYEPKWLAIADSAFFVDAARPQTQMRLRWDSGFDLHHPDRAEYFWARERVNQLEPTGPCTRHGFGKGPGCIPRSVDYEDLSLYMEGASGKFGAFIETPYREIDPTSSAISPAVCCGKSGFGDLTIGTKSMLLDCELTQITFQFKTFLPTGDFTGGLGTSHVSLEPSLLFNLKLTCWTYLQGQFSYWISVGGDNLYQGNIFHCHFSFNHALWKPMHDVQLIGTVEMNEWTVLGGNFTNPDFLITAGGRTGPVPVSASTSMFSIGPGLRLFVCDKIDVGVGSAFSLTGDHWAEELVRGEFRWRF
jgi:hypothetical protein